MSRIAFADTGSVHGQGGFVVAEEASPAPSVAGATVAAPEDLQNPLMLFGDLSVRRADAAAREHIAHVVDAGLTSTDSDAPYETSFDPWGGVATKLACLVLEAKRDIAACEIVAMRAVGRINEEIADIVLHVSVIAMGNTLDHHGEARFPLVGPYVHAA